MHRSLMFMASLLMMSNANAAPSLVSYVTPQNKLVIAGLKPGKLYGVIATTPRNGIGVKNFTSNACGELVIDQASNFQTITINRQKLIIKNLPAQSQPNCTKTLPLPLPTKSPT